MDPAAAKQQIAERVKQATKFLVTVNANPTVDQLAACIGLTLMLNKMGKHATAVFSGRIPSTIGFLQPEKTLQTSADSLRDFIISLDKNKADKLRYKVEDDVVRIFITPYQSSISEKDLIFSEGDFNVEAVIALGVTQRTQLDAAITAHGRILHDASVISINNGQGNAPNIGQINWQDASASSLSEMLVSISESFGASLIDGQIATAFLTGIVSETQRFSNKKTSPKVMTMSAQLMAAGANQQLIVSKLEPPAPAAPPPQPPPQQPPPPPKPPAPPPKPPEPKKPKPPPLKPEGVIDIPKGNNKDQKTNVDLGTTEIHIDEQGNLLLNQEVPPPLAPIPAISDTEAIKLEEQAALPPETPAAALPVEEISPSPPPTPPAAVPTSPPPEIQLESMSTPSAPAEPPLPEIKPMSSAPASTTPWFEPPQQQATRRPEPASIPPPSEQHHSFLGSTAQPAGMGLPVSSSTQPDWATPYDLIPQDPMSGPGMGSSEFGSTPVTTNPEASQNNFSQGHPMGPGSAAAPVDSARNAVESALNGAPFNPANEPMQSLNAQPIDVQPIHDEPQPAPTVQPAMQTSDTPMLILPTDGSSSLTASQPIATQGGQQAVAPPPVPPPLITGQGAIVPSPPQQQ